MTQQALSAYDSPTLLGTCACGHGLLEHKPCPCRSSCINHLGQCEWCGCKEAS